MRILRTSSKFYPDSSFPPPVIHIVPAGIHLLCFLSQLKWWLLQDRNVSVCSLTSLSRVMLPELALSKLVYLCLSALSFTGVSFPHPHSNKCVVVNFPFVPDSEKRGHYFVLSYWTQKDEPSGRKPKYPYTMFNLSIYTSLLLSQYFHLLQPTPWKQWCSLLSRLLYRTHQQPFLRAEFWIKFQFANHLQVEICV